MDNQGQNIQHHSKRRRLVLFPFPFQGHINPMIQLANILYDKGFNITIIHTKYNCPNLSNYPHFTIHFIPDGISGSEFSTNAAFMIKLFNDKCVKPFRDCLARLLSDDADDPVGCIIADSMWFFTREVADNLKIPRIVLRTSSFGALLAYSAQPLFQDKGYLSMKGSEMDEPVWEFPPLKVKDIPMFETQNPDEGYQVVAKMVEETKRASGLIFNTFKELEEPEFDKLNEQFLMPTFTIGPFHRYFSASSSSLWTQDRTSISWLDAQAPKSVIYVSFGSVAAMREEKLNEVAWGLTNSAQPFLWVVRPGLVHGSEWLETLPKEFVEAISKRGYIVKWAPQQEVLSHPATGGFWTHSGWNSTLESICEGIPMICSPFFGDQKVNSRYVNVIWKVGIMLEKGLERVEIESAIKKLMVGKEGEDMRKNIMCLKEKLDLSLKPGGSSYQSLDHLVDFISSFGSLVDPSQM